MDPFKIKNDVLFKRDLFVYFQVADHIFFYFFLYSKILFLLSWLLALAKGQCYKTCFNVPSMASFSFSIALNNQQDILRHVDKYPFNIWSWDLN